MDYGYFGLGIRDYGLWFDSTANCAVADDAY
jgi:hypothetical protein